MTVPFPVVLRIAAAHCTGWLLLAGWVNAGEIHDAVRINDLQTVKSLVEKNPASINSRGSEQVLPLHEAVRYGDAEMVRFLIEKGADVNARCYNDFTPLHLTSDVEIARILVASGADLQARAVSGTPLQDAVSDENRELIDFYLQAGCKLEFEELVQLGRVDEVQALLKSQPWLAKPPRHCLDMAASRGDLPMVKLLLEHGADPNFDFGFMNVSGIYSPLSSAVVWNRYEVAELLLQHGARIDVSGGKFYHNLFHEAVAEQDIRIVRLMLEHGADVNAPQGAFVPMTPLHVAASVGDLPKCQLLVDFKADVNALTPDGATPLDFAAAFGHAAVCELLLEHGAQLNIRTACALGKVTDVEQFLTATPALVNARDERLRRTPLHWAAQRGDRQLVDLLIRAGADVNAKAPPFNQASNVVTGPEIWGAEDADKTGETPLHVAAHLGHTEVLQALLENGADVNAASDEGATPLKNAVYARQSAAVKLLLEHGALVDVDGDSCLPAAEDNLEVTRLLLAHHPEQAGLNAALSAAAAEHPEVAALLLEAGAQADVFAASSLGLNDRIVELLDASPNLVNSEQADYPRQRPLVLAATNGQLASVKLLLERGAEVQPAKEATPMQEAAGHGYLQILDLLLAHGADVNHKDSMGNTSLHAAAGQLEATEWLLGHGANPLARDVYHATALHTAARAGAVAVIRRLIEAGVPVDSRDDFGETPLHESADDGRTEAAEVLLQNGADINAKNRRGQTPLFYAERERDRRMYFDDGIDRGPVAALLRSKGATK